MRNQVQLITYVDRLGGGGIRELRASLTGPLGGLFGGVHLLPFFSKIDGVDAGFDPTDHARVDPRLGSWRDVAALGRKVEITADLIVNHISTESPQFQDYSRNGERSPFAGMFLRLGAVFPHGATEADLLKIYRPRPGLPFTSVRLRNGESRLIWTTFTAQQVDIDVRSPAGAEYLREILDRFRNGGVRVIRLDAVGYAIKKAGTSCFMIPETFEYIAELTGEAHSRGMEILVEIHSYYQDQVEIARRVDRVYDFALPPLVLHAIYTQDAGPLKNWLAISPRNAVTVLDTHDGIGVIDVGADAKDPERRPGLLPGNNIDALVETIHQRSKGQSKQATGAAASNLDLYQVNCTFWDALGRRDGEYLVARAIQFFAPGIPQVYYVGLLAGVNDMELLARSGIGRDINRHRYSRAEILADLERPVVRRLMTLIRFRNQHPAFAGEFSMPGADRDGGLTLEWRRGPDWARLEVDLARGSARIAHSSPLGEKAWTV
ncbi:MAG TPA: sucrose phosphorylase [Bryobacteraceae bacterium]|nr:sucrose phosphorylase [Bryobacteraceae bacterium]